MKSRKGAGFRESQLNRSKFIKHEDPPIQIPTHPLIDREMEMLTMGRHIVATYVALAFILVGAVLKPGDVKAQAMADYTSAPPFVSDTVPPNIMLVFDNSGSMSALASSGQTFSNANTYGGIFEPTECYQYASGRFQLNPASNPAAPGTCTTSPYLWSGNLLNFVTMRRVDIAKYVIIGGRCAPGGRDGQGRCTTTLEVESTGIKNAGAEVDTALVTNLVPSSLLSGIGSKLHVLNPGNVVGRPSVPALVGSFCVDDDATFPLESDTSCTDAADPYNETQYWIKVDVTKPSGGVLQDVGTKARFAVMHYDISGNSEGGQVVVNMGSDVTTLVDTTEGITWPGVGLGDTTLAESLYEATRYYAQIAPAYNAANYTYTVTAQDPYYFTAPQWAGTSGYVDCCKSYVIMFTDGESVEDQNIPPALQDYADGIHGSHCTGSGCSGHRTDYGSNGSHYLDDVAYWAHTTDLRQGTIPVINETGKDLAGFQNLTVYTFFAFGSGSELLQSTAKAGGFDDLDGDGLGPNGANTPNLQAEWDKVDNTTGAVGSDGIPDTYFESSNADTIRERLLATIESIIQRSAAGSSTSILASSSTGEGALYQSFFFPATFEGLNQVKWTGYTQGLFFDAFGNLREDTNGDAKLVYQDDYIVQMRFDQATNEVLLDRFVDNNEDGQPDTPGSPVSTVGLKQVNSLWEAGTRLALTASSSRKLLTWVDNDDNGTMETKLAFDNGDGGVNNSAVLAPYLRAEAAPSPYTADAIINFIRGCEPATCTEQASLRDRQLTVGGSSKVWKLGDAIHAQPVVVGAPAQRYDVIYGDSSYTAYFAQYKDRRQVAYVGANDGMLHAFNAGYYHRGDDTTTSGPVEHGWFTRTPTDNSGGPFLGDELWGFIPQELLPHLKWLTDPNYTHVYYVDLKPKVTDARIFTPDADHPNGWGTILMGGFRMGGSCGSCTSGTGAPPMQVTADWDNNAGTADTTRTFYSAYFVLDITNPEVDPTLLWSFSSSDLGLTTTVPSMLRVSLQTDAITNNTNAKWYMVVGSGPTGYDFGTTQDGNLYAIDLKQGPGVNNTNVTTLPAETVHDAFLGTPLSIDRDFDYKVEVSYMGSVIDDGTLPWRGKLFRLTMNTCAATPCSTNTWGIPSGSDRAPTEILDTFGGNELGPIAASPSVALDDSNQLWVFAGTGRYFSLSDKTNTDQQYFVGVKDSVLNGACTESTATNCHDDNLLNVSGAQVCVLGIGDCGGTTDQVTGVTGATDYAGLINLVATKDGWYTSLSSGERSLARPLVFAGIVFFPTFTPTNDPCASTGTSQLYALYYLTGTASSSPIIGTTPSGTNKNINRSTSLGEGLASEVNVHIGEGSKEKQVNLCSQNSSGEVSCIKSGTAFAFVSRFLSWNQPYD